MLQDKMEEVRLKGRDRKRDRKGSEGAEGAERVEGLRSDRRRGNEKVVNGQKEGMEEVQGLRRGKIKKSYKWNWKGCEREEEA